MKKILKNQHEERIASKNDELNDAHLSNKITQQIKKADKPYSKQWKDWYMGTKLFSYIANGFSSFTQCFALFMFASATITGTFALFGIGVLSILLALLIEYLKRGAADKFMFSAVWQKELRGATIAKWLFMSLISIGASFYACTQLPKTYTQIANPIPPVDTATVVAVYQKQIATQEKILESQRSETKSDGRLRYGVSAKIDKTNQRIDSLYKAQDAALLAATQAYQTAVEQKAEKDESIGYLLAYCSIGLEVLFALALWYESKYLYNCMLERNYQIIEESKERQRAIDKLEEKKKAYDSWHQEKRQELIDKSQTLQKQMEEIRERERALEEKERTLTRNNEESKPKKIEINPHQAPKARKPIGFEIPKKEVQELPTPPTKVEINTKLEHENGDRLNDDRSEKQNGDRSTLIAKELKENERECSHCGTIFTYKHWNAKYCSDECRKKAWEKRTNSTFKKKTRKV